MELPCLFNDFLFRVCEEVFSRPILLFFPECNKRLFDYTKCTALRISPLNSSSLKVSGWENVIIIESNANGWGTDNC